MINFNWRELSAAENECQITDGTIFPYEYKIENTLTLAQVNAIAQEGWRVKAIKDPTDPLKLNVLFEKGGGYAMTCGGSAGEQFAIIGQAISNATTTEFLISKNWTYGDIAITGLLILIASWAIFLGLYKIIRRKNYNK